MDSSYQKFLLQKEWFGRERPAHRIWIGFSVFQAHSCVLSYKGQPAAHVSLLLYSQGAGVSYRSADSRDVSFKGRLETKTQTCRLSEDSVKAALSQLQYDGLIQRERTKNKRGRFTATRFTLLDPETRKPLQTLPMEHRLLTANHGTNFITIPRACLEAVNQMERSSEKAVYIAALSLATKEKSELVYITPFDWMNKSGLSRNAFGRAVKCCRHKGLLSYKSHILTLHDPATGKPSERWKSERARMQHENAHWEFDLNTVTRDEWRAVTEKLLGRAFDSADGWTVTAKEIACPFCRETQSFTVSFSFAAYKCHACGRKGRLGQLVQRVKNVSMTEAKQFIQQVQEPEIAI